MSLSPSILCSVHLFTQPPVQMLLLTEERAEEHPSESGTPDRAPLNQRVLCVQISSPGSFRSILPV